MEEREVVIDTEEIEKFLYSALISCGLAPGEEEVELLADLFFDYLIKLGVIAEEFDEDNF